MFPVCGPNTSLSFVWHQLSPCQFWNTGGSVFLSSKAVLLLVTQAVPRVSGSTNLPIHAILAGDPLHPVS